MLWGWWILFLLLIVIFGVGVYICLKLFESVEFVKVEVEGRRVWMLVFDVICKYLKEVLMVMGLCVVENGVLYIVIVFVFVYGKFIGVLN